MAANDARDYRDADGPNETARSTERDDSSAGGPEPTGSETAAALGAPTPTSDTKQAAGSDEG